MLLLVQKVLRLKQIEYGLHKESVTVISKIEFYLLQDGCKFNHHVKDGDGELLLEIAVSSFLDSRKMSVDSAAGVGN